MLEFATAAFAGAFDTSSSSSSSSGIDLARFAARLDRPVTAPLPLPVFSCSGRLRAGLGVGKAEAASSFSFPLSFFSSFSVTLSLSACFLLSPLMVKKLVREACRFSGGREGPAMAW